METTSLSCVSSLKDEVEPVYVQPHYKESYRLAVYALTSGGRAAYEDFIQAERIASFLSDDEIRFIAENAEFPVPEEEREEREEEEEARRSAVAQERSPPTYFPTESDEAVPELDLGWPEPGPDDVDTSLSLLFHPPRPHTPSVKDVTRRQIQDAKQVIAVAMDVFTDVDILQELVGAALRGVAVYILLDHAHFSSFLTMMDRFGIKIHNLKNLRVRTLKGPQYQCQSGVKFHGALEQRFLLVDCSTVMYGTYSYTWSFEKLNVSMVLVITGQLVASYDEEFRRLYARSAVPTASSQDRLRPPLSVLSPASSQDRLRPPLSVLSPASSQDRLRPPLSVLSPASSQRSLNQASRATQGLRGSNGDRYHAGSALSRGLSMQERLHQSHYPDMGCLVRGNSYGGELQRANSTSRLRTGAPEKPVTRGGEDPLAPSSWMTRFYHQQRSRLPPDQHLLPYNSETSLHRWKMDSYLSNGDAPADAPYSVVSPQSSQTGLNESQSPAFQGRAREIRSRLEEIRTKRLSLQEYNGTVTSPRQSQESLGSAYSTLDRSTWRSSLKALASSYNAAELQQNTRHGFNLEPAYKGDGLRPRDQPEEGGTARGTGREQSFTPAALTDEHRSTSQCDIKTVYDRKTAETYDWYEPLSRAASAANLDVKLAEPSLKPHSVRPSGLGAPHARVMQSLHEIPEEKEGPARGSSGSVNSSGPAALRDEKRTTSKDEKKSTSKDEKKSTSKEEVRAMNSTASNMSAPGPQRRDSTRERNDSMRSSGSVAVKKATSNKETTAPKGDPVTSDVSAGAQLVVKAKGSVQNVQTQREEPTPRTKSSTPSKETPTLQRKDSVRSKETPTLQRKDSIKSKETPTLQRRNSLRLKVLNIFTSDEQKKAQKEEKTLQRRHSTQSSKTPPGPVPPSTPPAGASPDGKPSALTSSKGHTAGPSRSLERRKPPSPLDRSASRRSSMRRPPAASDQDRGSRVTLEDEGASVPQARRDKAYSRFEHFLTTERNPPDRSGQVRAAAVYPSDRERGSFASADARGYSRYQTQPATDNKLGRFMQRLMGKNK